MKEYKIIKGFENYSISNSGNVKNNITGQQLKPFKVNGYCRVNLRNGEKAIHKRVHMLVGIEFLPNPDNRPFIDHINTIRDDNRVENLRWATREESNINQKLQTNNKTGFKAVSFEKTKWVSTITKDGKVIYLGSFNTKDEAIEARVLKAFELFGEFMNESEKMQYDIIQLKKQQ